MSLFPSPPSSPEPEPHFTLAVPTPFTLNLVDDRKLRAQRRSDRKAAKMLDIVIVREHTPTDTNGARILIDRDEGEESPDVADNYSAQGLSNGASRQAKSYPGSASPTQRRLGKFLRAGRRKEEHGEDAPLIGVTVVGLDEPPAAAKHRLRPMGALFDTLRKRKSTAPVDKADRATLSSTTRLTTVNQPDQSQSPFLDVSRESGQGLRRRRSTCHSIRSTRSTASGTHGPLTPATPTSPASAFSDISNASFTDYISGAPGTHWSESRNRRTASKKQAQIRSRTKTMQILGSEVGAASLQDESIHPRHIKQHKKVQ
ncbi:hypothetical protein CERSUDRAFT_98014 [Gelatoporia subvermispora B]|uniref:Uncharacterized protein n=1 Tax=Ceriporiopsis subvermispora (strain B) TaxID=914234 RepID=M2QPJ1_CERS8|nr:hypothetical protein CERSUDRAFT_98014 [Gelatoporia subvermispora B]